MRAVFAIMLLVAGIVAGSGLAAAEPLRFWNLTNATVTSLRLAPAGSTAFGPNQCANDKDGEVDHNERLALTGVMPGRYDVEVSLKQGRMCMARNVTLRGEGKYAFSLEPGDLTDCH